MLASESRLRARSRASPEGSGKSWRVVPVNSKEVLPGLDMLVQPLGSIALPLLWLFCLSQKHAVDEFSMPNNRR